MYRNLNSLFPRNTEDRLLSLVPYPELYSEGISDFVNIPLNHDTIDDSQKFIGENQMGERKQNICSLQQISRCKIAFRICWKA